MSEHGSKAATADGAHAGETRRDFIHIAAATVALTLMVATRWQRIISGPIERLSHTMQTISVGKDYSIRAAAESKDEIGALVAVFNDMLTTIEERNQALLTTNRRLSDNESELKAINERLEQRVAERTAELQALFDSASVGIVLLRNGLIVHSNRRLDELFGYAPGEQLGQPARVWLAEPDDPAAELDGGSSLGLKGNVVLARGTAPAVLAQSSADLMFSDNRCELNGLRVAAAVALASRAIIASSNRVVDLQREGIDLALRYCPDRDVPDGAVRLFGETVFPVASPALGVSALDAATLPELTLLYFDVPGFAWLNWDDWLTADGLGTLRPRGTLHFNHYDQLIQAAVAGQGVAIGRAELVSPLLERGQLRRIGCAHREVSGRGYWLLRADAMPRDDVRRFAAWIVEAARQTRDGLATTLGAPTP